MLPINAASSVQTPTEAELVSRISIPFLQFAQNQDGGWGFRPGSNSRVEASSWAVLALGTQASQSAKSMQERGFRFLRASQLQDGSWPASPGQTVGCWITSLACLALMTDTGSGTAVAQGLRWICEDSPRSRSFVKRVIRKIARVKEISRQNDSLRGWGWTPRTASWVEPTSFALIALEQAPKEVLPNDAPRRRDIAKLMLYDRMCPGGGWNCGNPMVYGVAGEPLVEPTVWALLALRNEPDTSEKSASLEWLEKNLSRTLGPGSLALAKICLEAYGRQWPAEAPKIASMYENHQFLGSVTVTALTCLAFERRGSFLGREK